MAGSQPTLDLQGQRYGRWTALERRPGKGTQGPRWLCRCDCGIEKWVAQPTLRNGQSTSCGCFREEIRPTLSKPLMDLQGLWFGRWTVTAEYRKAEPPNRQPMVLCRCKCGTEKWVAACSLRNGTSRSCGCLHSESSSARFKTHGQSGTLVYAVWRAMRERCFDTEHPSWLTYGGRGIGVCDRWLKFENFIADMGPRPPGGTIERINNDGWYEPSNCRWATRKEQARNFSRNRLIEYDGRTQCLLDWANERRIKRTTLERRLDVCGWTLAEALGFAAPPRRQGQHRKAA
jgi:hypothetical protein